MKTSRVMVVSAIALTGVAAMGLAGLRAQQKHGPAVTPEMQAMMDAHRKAIEPGALHQGLMNLAGEYTTKETFYLPGAKEPTLSDGAATIKNEMGGRFLVEHDNGSYLGEPYVGVRIYGYNNGSKQYEGVWTYNQSTSIMNLSGSSKDGGKTIDFTANFKDDDSGKATSMDIKLKVIDPDHFQVELKSTMPNGSAGPHVVTAYSRKTS